MKLFPAHSLVRRPWKNGGGETMEIAASPLGATRDHFNWRLSTAIVASDGAFSTFTNIDRTLNVLEGGPMILSLKGGVEITLDSQSAPLSFAGDLPVSARVLGFPVRDLNIMTRRGVFSHRVTPMVLLHEQRTIAASAPFFLISRSDDITLSTHSGENHLSKYDTAFFDEAETGQVKMKSSGHAVILLVEIFACG